MPHNRQGFLRRRPSGRAWSLLAWAAIVAVPAGAHWAHSAEPAGALEPLPLEIVGLSVTPHVYSREIRYGREPRLQGGSLVRLVIRHVDPGADPLALELTVSGRKPSELVANGEWSWHETPESLGTPDRPYQLAPGAWDVFTLNGVSANWASGGRATLTLAAPRSGAREDFEFSLQPPPIRLTRVALLAADDPAPDDVRLRLPERGVIHIENASSEAWRIVGVQSYVLRSDSVDGPGGSARGYLPGPAAIEVRPFAGQGEIPPGQRGGATFRFTAAFPLARGLLAARLVDAAGTPLTLWAHLRFKVERFDIGAGWLDIPSREPDADDAGGRRVVPLAHETFLKLLRRMHVNLAHVEHVPGYLEAAGPTALYERYPLRLMNGLDDVAKYNEDAWVGRIHGVDKVGEPQMGLRPQATYEALRPYDQARYPTTVTLSMDSGFRDYAGLSDYPHFDAYRVTAPAADQWMKYDRWPEGRIFWGAPLEGIGEMTRTLNALSRPAPIAIWSQNVHEGWQGGLGRKRRSPTPDEIRAQAYQGLANGVTSLYWYSLQSWSLLAYRDAIAVTTELGREMRMLEPLLVVADPAWHQRQTREGRPDLDLNTLITPTALVAFALDLDYYPDKQAQEFRFRGPRTLSLEWPVPKFLHPLADVFRVSHAGVHDVDWEPTDTGFRVRDSLDRAAIYVAAPTAEWRAKLIQRHAHWVTWEEATGLDPATNDADFQRLMEDLGFQSLDEVGPPRKRRRDR